MHFGHFSDDGREYIITRFPTPRTWENFIGNDDYGVRVEETGGGYSLLPSSPGCRVTYASAGEPCGKVFYLRDRDSGRHWSLTWQPVDAPYDDFRCRHGLGYTIFDMTCEGIESSLRVFVPVKERAEIWTATIRNASDRSRSLTLFPYVEWHLVPHMKPWDNYRNYIAAHWSQDERLVVAEMNDPAHPGQSFVGFAGVDPAPSNWDAERTSFIGDGSLAAPAAVVRGNCADSDMPGDGRAIAAFAVDLDLPPGGEATVTLIIGFSGDAQERRQLRDRYLSPAGAEKAFEELRDQWRGIEQQPFIQTPDSRLDRMTNLWLKANIRQLTRSIREGLRGYRDTIQDAMGATSFDSAMARLRLTEALSHQYEDGSAPRQFSYHGGPHDLRVYNDSPLWLLLAVARYLKETGDFALLDEPIGFFESAESASVFDHLRRAVDWLDQRRGYHGLIRIDRGDWCDALDEVGKDGMGVSVWLSQAFHLAVSEFAEICSLHGDSEMALGYRQCADDLREKLDGHAWDEDRYICAISDRGRRLGARGEPTMEIYLNTQTWAVIGRAGDLARAARALDSAHAKLDCPYGPLLFDPAYRSYDPDVGRLSVLRPGCGENGTVYVHAAVFCALADLMVRQPDRALEVLTRVAPMMERHDPEVTQAAPYAYANSYVGPAYPAHAGRTITNWYTSSPSWTLFIVTDWLLGVRPTYEGLLIDPCLPSDWESASLRREWRDATYEVTITKPKGLVTGMAQVTVDGARQPANLVPAFADGKVHQVLVRLVSG
ncbi:MAG: GH36-type glycosyl hydrolase domain-containing protein [Armatimonadota bacterium]